MYFKQSFVIKRSENIWQFGDCPQWKVCRPPNVQDSGEGSTFFIASKLQSNGSKMGRETHDTQFNLLPYDMCQGPVVSVKQFAFLFCWRVCVERQDIALCVMSVS